MPNSQGQSLFSKQVHPRILALLAFGGVLLFSLLGQFMNFGSDKMFEQFPWMIAAAFMLVFAIFNSVFWISSTNTSKYLSQSIIYYVLLAMASGLLAYAISGISPNEAGSIRAIFIILTIGYMVFMAIMGTIKFLIGFFNQEEKNKLEGKNKIQRRKRR